MKLITFSRDGDQRAGAFIDDGIIDLTAHLGVGSVQALLQSDRLADAESLASSHGSDYGRDDITLELPITNPQKIFCVGVNYMNRNAEYKDGSDIPNYPSLFMRTPMSFVPNGADLIIPYESDQFDYEGEIVIVIGRAGRRISEARALDHVAGLTIMNEGSVRDWLRHGKFNVTQGKNFDRSGAIGPWIETGVDRHAMTDLAIETRVNGEVRQSDTTASMAFPFAHLIAYISTFCTLQPGDLIATGTPTGAGARFDPPKWLVPGDTVDVTVTGIGTLSNRVAAEPTADHA